MSVYVCHAQSREEVPAAWCRSLCFSRPPPREDTVTAHGRDQHLWKALHSSIAAIVLLMVHRWVWPLDDRGTYIHPSFLPSIHPSIHPFILIHTWLFNDTYHFIYLPPTGIPAYIAACLAAWLPACLPATLHASGYLFIYITLLSLSIHLPMSLQTHAHLADALPRACRKSIPENPHPKL